MQNGSVMQQRHDAVVEVVKAVACLVQPSFGLLSFRSCLLLCRLHPVLQFLHSQSTQSAFLAAY